MAPLDDAASKNRRDVGSELSGLASRLREAENYLNIATLRARKVSLEDEAARPDLWDTPDLARTITTELGRLNDDLSFFDSLENELDDASVLLQLVEEDHNEGGKDESLIFELIETIDALSVRLSRLEMQSLFQGDHDDRDAICEIHAGAGGTDSQDWAEMMFRMYQRWAERRGFRVEVEEETPGQEAGLLSATFIVHGRFAYGLMSTERGVHRLVRISPFDSQHRRHTSFASFDAVPALDNVDEVDIDEKDLRVDTYRSSGAGGQHVNKTDSAVRITHLPTNTVVAVQNERSQHQNRAKAMQILGAKLAELARLERQRELDVISGERSDNAWGSQIRSYVLAPYQLVKDLRTGTETGNVAAVLDGDLDAFMESELQRKRSAQAD